METIDLTDAILVVDSHHGVYAPQFFIQQFADKMVGLPDDVKQDLLAGPDNEYYWDAWDYASSCLVVVNGEKYYIHHEEDIWLIPVN